MPYFLRHTSTAASIRALARPSFFRTRNTLYNGVASQKRYFGRTPGLFAVKPFLLADIGEGITECQVVSWLVKPGDQVQEFDPICEVQSDKASVEITSRFEGRIEKLHYEAGDMAVVGSSLLDIDVDDGEEGTELQTPSPDTRNGHRDQSEAKTVSTEAQSQPDQPTSVTWKPPKSSEMEQDYDSLFLKQTGPALVSPAVRRLLKENNIDVTEVQGTGRDQRILKGDVQKFLEARVDGEAPRHGQQPSTSTNATSTEPPPSDRIVRLSPVQMGMFKSMTQSLSIPHFLYTHTVDLTALMSVSQKVSQNPSTAAELQNADGTAIKLTLLPFVLKALSMAVASFPVVNSRLLRTEGGHPELEIKGAHNFGLAVDTHNGLLVPVVRNVQDLSIASLAREISRLGHVAREGKLKPEDMQDATLVISNIGSIGGQVVAPVILSPMTAIVAVSKIEQVPTFAVDDDGNEIIVKKTQAVLSWSADHRVLDGATVARCAQQVALWLENVDYLGLSLK